MKRIEHCVERVIFASRWLVAPIYLGLCASLLLLLYGFANHAIGVIYRLTTLQNDDIILAILEFIDFSLVGNLVILVVFSGFENFVSRMHLGNHEDIPSWKGTVDFTNLKLKLLSSVIAIASINLLQVFLELKEIDQKAVMGHLIIYVILVLSGLIMALMDYIATLTHKKKH